jgi:hypothetical protein
MVTILGLVSFALILCTLLLVRGTARQNTAAPQLRKSDRRQEGTRATGIN